MERTYENRFEDRIELNESSQQIALTVSQKAAGSVLIFAAAPAKSADITLRAAQDSSIRVVLVNESENDLQLDIHVDVAKDASVRFGLLDLNERAQKLTFSGELNEPGAWLDLTSASLCLKDQRKDGAINITSHAPYTYGNMNNFAVCFAGGIYSMAAAGRIDDGCHDSASHQQTRVLTMEKNHKVTVIPILYIDENEVKASHALTIGQPDASQLYYLQSRGLSDKQAIGLLAIGYFKPVIDLIEDEALRDSMRTEMERRVGLYGH